MADRAVVKSSPPDGVIRFEVDKVSALDLVGKYSHEVQVKGIPWMVVVYKRGPDNNYSLSAALNCMNSQSTKWNVDVDAEFILLHSNNNANIVKEEYRTLKYDYWGLWEELMDWQEFINNKKGFIIDDKITLEVRFWISKMKGIKIVPRVDFADPNEPFHDIALVIGGEKIYASKQFLSIHSLVFKAMFYGDFAERNKEEIELKDIDCMEFIGLLKVIYPSNAKISDANVCYLLKLADRFEMKGVIDKVESYLMGFCNSGISIAAKLWISDQYNLADLQEFCLDSFTTVEEITKIKDTEGYRNLSKDAKSALMDRVMQLA